MIPWSYTGANVPAIHTVTQISTDKYYFKIMISDNYVYHGPLYLSSDGTYRSNNSRDANIMYQKGLLNTEPTMYPNSWNAPFKTLPVVESPYSLTARVEPVDKYYRLIILQPRSRATSAARPPHLPPRWRSSYGHILYFRWDNSVGTGQYVTGGTITPVGIMESISEITWIREQTRGVYQPAYNLAYIQLVKQRNLNKQVYRIIKKRNKRTQLKALGKSAAKWAIRNLNTVTVNDFKKGRVPSIIDVISIFGPGANNIRCRISKFL